MEANIQQVLFRLVHVLQVCVVADLLDALLRGDDFIVARHHRDGAELRAVAVMACDDEVIPSQQRIEEVGDDADLEDVYETERHLLYVASTRARDELLVTGVAPGSEFLQDLS